MCAVQYYLNYAKENHDYSEEYAPGMLHYYNNDLHRACQDMAKFVPVPDEWTDEERTLFMKAYYLYRTDFHYYKWIVSVPFRAFIVRIFIAFFVCLVFLLTYSFLGYLFVDW